MSGLGIAIDLARHQRARDTDLPEITRSTTIGEGLQIGGTLHVEDIVTEVHRVATIMMIQGNGMLGLDLPRGGHRWMIIPHLAALIQKRIIPHPAEDMEHAVPLLHMQMIRMRTAIAAATDRRHHVALGVPHGVDMEATTKDGTGECLPFSLQEELGAIQD